MAAQHSTKMQWGTEAALCDTARTHLFARATGSGGSGFTTRGFSRDDVTCAACAGLLERGISAMPSPEIRQGPPVRSKLLDAIKSQMRAKYGPAIEREEWETESYR